MRFNFTSPLLLITARIVWIRSNGQVVVSLSQSRKKSEDGDDKPFRFTGIVGLLVADNIDRRRQRGDILHADSEPIVERFSNRLDSRGRRAQRHNRHSGQRFAGHQAVGRL